MKSLPENIKPSALIRLAIRDEEKAHASKEYRVEMGAWHVPGTYECAVCFAGAVMAFSLDADPKRDLSPEYCDVYTKNCLYALHAFRKGFTAEGLRDMGIQKKSIRKFRKITPYADDRDAFLAAMEKLAKEFEAIDL